MSIHVKGVTKYYGQQKALDDITLSIPSGDVVGFLGPNGAGKSTLMRIITGFIQPSSGIVEVGGLPLVNQRVDYRMHIGYLPENNPLYPDMYVKEYLHFVSKVYGLGRLGGRRVKELIEQVGINHEQNKRIGELSKGYRQRVGLAQALLNRPSVLILDEPTSGLDPNQIVEIRRLIKDLGREKTVMLSTHIMQEVEAICSRVIIINRGKIVADDSTQRVLSMAKTTEQSLMVEFQGEVDEERLLGIAGVTSVSHVAQNTWLISSNLAEDLRPLVFRFAVDSGITILTLQPKTLLMEEVFQSLTAEGVQG